MAETNVESITAATDWRRHGPSPQARLADFLATHKISIARTAEELFAKSAKSGQPQEEIQAEVDEFMRMREEWRAADLTAQREID